MHFGDSIFIFLLALVLFGPKKLPEIGRTIGKLLAEFRRASNEFKFQIQEELRTMEDDERKKKLAEQQAQRAPEALPAPDASTSATTPSILPPSSGAQVSTGAPYATPVEPAELSSGETPVTPSAPEVIVEPAAPLTEDPTPLSPSHVDLSARANGAHPDEPAASVEPIESIVPDETVRHG